MKPRWRTPRDLVEALQRQTDGARQRLWEALRAPLGRLMGEVIVRLNLDLDRERLTLHALHLAETWLRTRPPREFDRLSWDSFRNAIVVHIARLALSPFGGRSGSPTGPTPLPACNTYQNETFFLPYERVGGFWYGGDWYGGRKADDGALWVIVADVTGHGYYAYLLASALPHVWEACWRAAAPNARPADLLRAMHTMLESCLPDGVYTECTLVRLDPKGEAVVAPAGGSRLLLRRRGASPDLMKLRGAWLGLFPPSAADQKTLSMAEGDELLLGSDGAFDHLDENADASRLGGASASLLEDVQRLLQEALRQGPQKDDITLVLLRRLVSPLRTGADDVSV
ncbi:MAG TPA: PP2C family protein-serine/threonine phosphatase [Gemmataceae bacterium]|nr:PP2C family protein-serine/threonine phosphatase [Gemmataceae bacterium]